MEKNWKTCRVLVTSMPIVKNPHFRRKAYFIFERTHSEVKIFLHGKKVAGLLPLDHTFFLTNKSVFPIWIDEKKITDD